MSRRVGGFGFDCQQKLRLGIRARPVPTMPYESERSACLGKRIVNLESLGRRILGLRERFFRLAYPVNHQHVVAVREPGIGGSVILVNFNSLSEIFNTLQ